MAKFSYLPENKRYKTIHLKEEGYSMRQIAAKVPCGLSTAVRTSKRFSETNFIADRGRSGRPRKTSLREDGLFLSNRKLNSSQILKQWTLTSNVSVYPRTVRGRLLEIGLRGCKARPKPLLTEFQRKRRLTWAREHSLWTIKDWEKEGENPRHMMEAARSARRVARQLDRPDCVVRRCWDQWIRDMSFKRRPG
ncbi:HTH_Tnp_Tc3_2 domain-containing protein [Trichonephila clavipes]|nr:HTH_Tnp_Tc3_2 domain-containing protein [Trichonephila clavipes]